MSEHPAKKGGFSKKKGGKGHNQATDEQLGNVKLAS